ncbi:unnamed protein product [Trichobilharzia regenti]|nr:unnamed protein product [Trichobilharzia regenti]
MVKYSWEPKDEDESKTCKARIPYLRTHFKNMHECACAVKGMTLQRAQTYLKNVIEKKEIIPFRKFNGGVGRHAQAKVWKTTQGRWPKKSAQMLLQLLHNAFSNGVYKDIKGGEASRLYIKHIQVFLWNFLLQFILATKDDIVPKVAAATPQLVKKKESKKKMKRQMMKENAGY